MQVPFVAPGGADAGGLRVPLRLLKDVQVQGGEEQRLRCVVRDGGAEADRSLRPFVLGQQLLDHTDGVARFVHQAQQEHLGAREGSQVARTYRGVARPAQQPQAFEAPFGVREVRGQHLADAQLGLGGPEAGGRYTGQQVRRLPPVGLGVGLLACCE